MLWALEKRESILGDFLKGITPQKSAKLSQVKVEDVKRGGWVGQFNWVVERMDEVGCERWLMKPEKLWQRFPPHQLVGGWVLGVISHHAAKTTSWSRRCIISMNSGGDGGWR